MNAPEETKEKSGKQLLADYQAKVAEIEAERAKSKDENKLTEKEKEYLKTLSKNKRRQLINRANGRPERLRPSKFGKSYF